MAGLLDLFSGRSSDLYGGALTPEQRGGLGNIGLLALAGKLGQLAGPSFSPVPDFGAALGQAAGAYGASQEGAGTAALNAILTGLKGQDLESQLAIRKQVLGLLPSLLAGDGAAAAAGAPATSGSTGGGAAAPLGAGGGGGDAPPIPQSEAVDKARYYARLYGVPEGMFLHQINGENGFKSSGVSSAGAQGIAQFIPSTAKQYGVNVNDVDSSLDGAARYMRDLYQKTGSWDGALRRYLGATSDATLAPILAKNKPYAAAFAAARGGGAPTAAPTAAAPAGGGGLLAPTAPNPLSDAEPMLPIARPRVGPQAAPAAVAPALSRPGASPEDTANQILRGWSAGSGGGGLLAAPPGAGTDSYVTPQGPAGDVGQAGPAGLPTMGPAGIELPPMQGPLAAPAPAAAAPAAPGPGLLAAPGAPAAAALPRGLLAPPAAALPPVPAAPNLNARALAAAGVLSQLGGLPDIFKPLENFYYQSPGYKGQVATAEAAAKSPFEIMLQDRTSANALRNALTEAGWGFDKDGNAVQIPGYNTVAEAKARSIALGTGEGQKPLELAKIQANLQADLLKNGQQLVIGMDGKPAVVQLPGAAEAAANAAKLKAEATPTQEAQNYGDYVKDAQMRNQPVLSRFDWERTKTQPDPVNAARIALDLKVAEPLAAQAAAGLQAKPLLDEVVRLAYQTPEGMAGEGSAAAGKLMAAFGFAPTDRMSNAELLTGVQQRLIGPIREPGTSSDRDVSRYLLATPGLMSTGDGRVKMAEMTKALIDRNNELATVYRNNLGSPDLQQKLTAIHNKPLFSDEQRAAIDETIRTRGGTVPGGVTPGERVPAATAPPASAAPPRIIQGPDGYKIEKNGQWVPYTPPGTVPMGR
jgi:hypothetical protein